MLLQATIICHIGEEFTTEQEVIMAWTGIPKNIAYTVQHYKIHHNNQQRLTLCRSSEYREAQYLACELLRYSIIELVT